MLYTKAMSGISEQVLPADPSVLAGNSIFIRLASRILAQPNPCLRR